MTLTEAKIDLYRKKINEKIITLTHSLGSKSRLRDACEYALKTGGKRFRPIIVLVVAEELGKGLEPMESALAAELFHTASLVADDLPCMDNDSLRRGLPSLHRAFNESTALLCTYALISEGYERIRLNGEAFGEKKGKITSLALECATRTTGIFGATLGQFYDLYPSSELDEGGVRKIICHKTVALFELSFVFGWLFGGGDLDMLPEVKKSAYHFGMAYQIADDIADQGDDEENFRVNFATVCGIERAKEALHQEKEALFASSQTLRLSLAPLSSIFS